MRCITTSIYLLDIKVKNRLFILFWWISYFYIYQIYTGQRGCLPFIKSFRFYWFPTPFLDGLVWRWLLAVSCQLSAISGQGSARLCMVFYKLKGGRLSAVGCQLSAISGQGSARLCMVFYKLKGGRRSAVSYQRSAVSGQGSARLCMVFYKLYTISYIL